MTTKTPTRSGGTRGELIHHGRPNDNFTMIPNAVMRDERLTPVEAAILWRLLSHTSGWHFNADTLAAQWPGLSKRAAESAVRGLRNHGYIHRIVTHAGSRRLRTELHLFSAIPDGCGLAGCQDCADRETADGQLSDPTEMRGQSDQGKHHVSAGGSDRASSDRQRMRGHIEDHREEDHKEDSLSPLATLARLVRDRAARFGVTVGERESQVIASTIKTRARGPAAGYLRSIPDDDLRMMIAEAAERAAVGIRPATPADDRAAAAPDCDHGTPAGKIPLPGQHAPRCPLCRAGAPAPPPAPPVSAAELADARRKVAALAGGPR